MPDSNNVPRLTETRPPRFGMRAMMATMTVVAVLICVLQNLGIIGALVAFIGAVLFSVVAIRRGATSDTDMAFDLIWGIVMPVLCLTFDPVLFQPDPNLALSQSLPTSEHFRLSSLALFGYLTLGTQMVTLLAWIMMGHMANRGAALAAGMLWCGFAIALMFSLAFPIGGIATIVTYFSGFDDFWQQMKWLGPKLWIAVLGVTPFFTTRAFYRRARQASATADRFGDASRNRQPFVIGALIACGTPLIGLFCIQGKTAFQELFPYFFP